MRVHHHQHHQGHWNLLRQHHRHRSKSYHRDYLVLGQVDLVKVLVLELKKDKCFQHHHYHQQNHHPIHQQYHQQLKRLHRHHHQLIL